MKAYEKLEMELIELSNVDVICTSGENGPFDVEDTGKNENTGDTGTFYPAKSLWN